MTKILSVEKLRLFQPLFGSIEVAVIKDNGITVGFHGNALSKSNEVLGSGCSTNLQMSKIIAIGEMIERTFCSRYQHSSVSKDFLLEEFPSSCGFAFGLDLASATRRALLESFERWAWSKWIDEKFFIPEASIDFKRLSPLARYHFNQFDSVIFFEKSFSFTTGNTKVFPKLGISIGIKNGGAFPGSKVILGKDDCWEHALLESWRHLKIFETENKLSGLIYERIRNFGADCKAALAQVPRTKSTNWPTAELRLLKSQSIPDLKSFIVRSLMSDYLPWHAGGSQRFVY